jgi:hypothetical protein
MLMVLPSGGGLFPGGVDSWDVLQLKINTSENTINKVFIILCFISVSLALLLFVGKPIYYVLLFVFFQLFFIFFSIVLNFVPILEDFSESGVVDTADTVVYLLKSLYNLFRIPMARGVSFSPKCF